MNSGSGMANDSSELRHAKYSPLSESLAPRGDAVKPFRLVKYFALGSFAAILAATAFLSVFFLQRDQNLLLRQSEEFALLLAENLNHQVFQKFVMPTALLYGKMSLRDPKQYNLLDTVVRTTIYGFNMERVTIFSHDGLMVYSTEYTIEQMLDKSQHQGTFGLAIEPNRKYQNALQGTAGSEVISRGSMFRLLYPGTKEGLKLLDTYAPFRVDLTLESKAEEVIGVLEITQDITSGFQFILKNQLLSIAIFFGVMTFLFVSLLFIVHRAEGIIHRRAEEKKRLEEQLNHAERLAGLGQMVAGVSHEIRNPLGIIRSTAEMLAQKSRQNDNESRLADLIVEESTRLNHVITEFLDFARPQVPKRVPCHLRAVIEHILDVVLPETSRGNIEVDTSKLEEPGALHADPDLIFRGLMNVINNAIQSMPEGGKLRVCLSNGDYQGVPVQTIQVEDTGEGIPQDVIPHVFQPFFTTREVGTGLGLSIVHNIVKAHGGWVIVESPVSSDLNPSSDRGTRVSLYIPTDDAVHA